MEVPEGYRLVAVKTASEEGFNKYFIPHSLNESLERESYRLMFLKIGTPKTSEIPLLKDVKLSTSIPNFLLNLDSILSKEEIYKDYPHLLL